MTPEFKLTKARAGLILDQPFFGAIALRLPLVSDSSIPTMATDGRDIRYNPKFVDSLPADQLKGVLAHEIMHICCQHNTRRGGRDHGKWNIAADYAINPILEESGFRLPPGGCDSSYKGKAAEEIYGSMGQDNSQGQGGGSGSQAGGAGGQSPVPSPASCGEVNDLPSGSDDGAAAGEAERKQFESEFKVTMQQAAQAAKMQGKLPGDLARLVADIISPKVDWREVLRRFMSQAAKNDYAWFPPNRRYIAQGLYLPSCRSEELPPLVVAVDTSGSINNALLRDFASELQAVVEDCNISSVHVLYCDTRVFVGPVYSKGDSVKLQARGGGGTNFTPVFDHVDKMDTIPCAVVYLTDGDGACHCSEPGYPVLWALTDESGEGYLPAWGERVSIK